MGYKPMCDATSSCPAVRAVLSVICDVFGFAFARQGQLEAIVPALHGHDVFIRMATGAGKSICMFSVPLAYSSSAIAVIFSPLNALMDEQVCYFISNGLSILMYHMQVLKLQSLGVKAIRVGAHNTCLYEEVKSGNYRISKGFD